MLSFFNRKRKLSENVHKNVFYQLKTVYNKKTTKLRLLEIWFLIELSCFNAEQIVITRRY